MATTRKTAAKSATPEEENTTPPEEVDNENAEENGEQQEEKAPIETFEEKVEKAYATLPETDDELLHAFMKRIMKNAVRARDFNETIRLNTINDDRVKDFMDNDTSNEEFNALRTDRNDRNAEIQRLQEQIDKLTAENVDVEQKMKMRSRAILEETVNGMARVRAKSNLDELQTETKDYMVSFRRMVGEGNVDSSPWVEFARTVNISLYGQSTTPSTGGSSGTYRTAADRSRTEQIRQWAKNNGIAVKDKGRIPEYVINEYNAKNPGAI